MFYHKNHGHGYISNTGEKKIKTTMKNIILIKQNAGRRIEISWETRWAIRPVDLKQIVIICKEMVIEDSSEGLELIQQNVSETNLTPCRMSFNSEETGPKRCARNVNEVCFNN